MIGGATIVSSLVKGEDINWGKVGANTLKGAAAGAGVISTAANYVNDRYSRKQVHKRVRPSWPSNKRDRSTWK